VHLFKRLRSLDPRWFQIASLSTLLCWGVFGLGFDVDAVVCVAMVLAAQATQWCATRVVRGAFDPKSALISSLSLCLLLRTNSVAVAVAVVAVASKFVLRVASAATAW
jgi:hypothetical protein